MSAMLEREIKLRFANAQEAREAVRALGASLVRERRFQDDALFDNEREELRARRCALRLRRERARSYLTFKGPGQPGPMKLREELETAVGDADALQRVLEHLGLRVWFRYQKYREEYTLDGVVAASTRRLSARSSSSKAPRRASPRRPPPWAARRRNYILESYCGLFIRYRDALGFRGAHMIFDEPDRLT